MWFYLIGSLFSLADPSVFILHHRGLFKLINKKKPKAHSPIVLSHKFHARRGAWELCEKLQLSRSMVTVKFSQQCNLLFIYFLLSIQCWIKSRNCLQKIIFYHCVKSLSAQVQRSEVSHPGWPEFGSLRPQCCHVICFSICDPSSFNNLLAAGLSVPREQLQPAVQHCTSTHDFSLLVAFIMQRLIYSKKIPPCSFTMKVRLQLSLSLPCSICSKQGK